MIEADFSLCLEKEFEDAAGKILGWISFSCETPSTARCPAVDSSMALWIPLSGALHDFKGFQLVRISVSFVTSA